MLFKFLLILFLITSNSYAYLDPASGSMLLTTLLSIIAGLYFFIKSFYYKIGKTVAALFGKQFEIQKKELILFSEGKQYWLTFKPLLESLLSKNIKIHFITMDNKDPGLLIKSDFFSSEYIGKGNKAYSYLSLLEANIVVSTTLGLDVLQIKKSKGVDHYLHIIHAPSSLYKCKLYSFDYFDSMFLSGPHQIDNIRYLENLRGTKKKELFKIGCLYYDEMIQEVSVQEQDSNITVLIAPSWDKNGLLNVYGSSVIKNLLKIANKIIIRPHPQSYVSEQKMLNNIKDELKIFDNIVWDNSTSPVKSMNECNVMISDYSSVTIDYLFLYKKPLVIMDFEINHLGSEGEDLKEGKLEHWEIEILNKVAKVCKNKDSLHTIVKEIYEDSKFLQKEIESIIDTSIYNFSNAKEDAAKKVIEILRRYKKC